MAISRETGRVFTGTRASVAGDIIDPSRFQGPVPEHLLPRRAANLESCSIVRRFLDGHPGLEFWLQLDHPKSRDLGRQLARVGALSPRQVALAHEIWLDAGSPAAAALEEKSPPEPTTPPEPAALAKPPEIIPELFLEPPVAAAAPPVVELSPKARQVLRDCHRLAGEAAKEGARYETVLFLAVTLFLEETDAQALRDRFHIDQAAALAVRAVELGLWSGDMPAAVNTRWKEWWLKEEGNATLAVICDSMALDGELQRIEDPATGEPRYAAPGVSVAPACRFCGGTTKRFGRTETGYQRYRCRSCSRVMSDSPRPQRGGNRLKAEKEAKLRELLAAGWSIRSAAAAAGVSKRTAELRAREIQATCPCGQPARHRGWCSWRFQRSPRRQEFLERWRPARGGAPPD